MRKFVALLAFLLCTAGTAKAQNYVAGSVTIAGPTNVTNTTPSTSPTTGALVVTGGLGVGGNIYGNGNGITVTPSGASVATLLPAILGRTVNVLDYGAKCDGATDDTAYIQAAINQIATTGGIVLFPAATCDVAGTLKISTNSIRLLGMGAGATVLNFTGTGTADAIQIGTFPSSSVCVGSTPPSNCQQVYNASVGDMTIDALSRTGGALIDVNGASQTILYNVQYIGWDLLYAQYFNDLILRDFDGYINDNANYGINITNQITTGTSSGWYRSDVITLNDVVMNAQNKGGNCFNADGMINTFRLNRVGLLNCHYGMAFSNSAHSTSYYPMFLFARDLELDGGSAPAIIINAGADFNITNSDIDAYRDTTVGDNIIVMAPDTGYSTTSRLTISDSAIHDGAGTAIYINCRDVILSGDRFFDLQHDPTATPDVITVAPSSVDVTIDSSQLGPSFSDPDKSTTGILVNAGAIGVSATGDNFDGLTNSNIINQSTTNAVGWIGGITNSGAVNSATTCAVNTTC